MKNSKFFRIAASAAGILLIAGAVLLFVSNRTKVTKKVDTDAAATFLSGIMPDRQNGIKEELSNKTMPAVSFDSTDFVGLLEVPRFSSVLPVVSSWDDGIIHSAPARYSGNPYDGTLAIGGVDSEGQLDFVSKIDIDDEITFTDLKGNEFSYIVKTVKHSKSLTPEKILDADYDLTVFAHDRNSGDYLLIRCSM